jgi:hypothetical protein
MYGLNRVRLGISLASIPSNRFLAPGANPKGTWVGEARGAHGRAHMWGQGGAVDGEAELVTPGYAGLSASAPGGHSG